MSMITHGVFLDLKGDLFMSRWYLSIFYYNKFKENHFSLQVFYTPSCLLADALEVLCMFSIFIFSLFSLFFHKQYIIFVLYNIHVSIIQFNPFLYFLYIFVTKYMALFFFSSVVDLCFLCVYEFFKLIYHLSLLDL